MPARLLAALAAPAALAEREGDERGAEDSCARRRPCEVGPGGTGNKAGATCARR